MILKYGSFFVSSKAFGNIFLSDINFFAKVKNFKILRNLILSNQFSWLTCIFPSVFPFFRMQNFTKKNMISFDKIASFLLSESLIKKGL